MKIEINGEDYTIKTDSTVIVNGKVVSSRTTSNDPSIKYTDKQISAAIVVGFAIGIFFSVFLYLFTHK